MLFSGRSSSWFKDPPENRAALKGAAGNGHTLVVQRLLEADNEPRHRKAACTEALQATAKGGHLDTFKVLLEAGASVHALADDGSCRTVVVTAVENGCIDVVQMAVEARAHINVPRDDRGCLASPLQVVTLRGHLLMVKCVLEAGSEVDGRQFVASSGPWGHGRMACATPLQIASKRGDLAIVDTLIRAGADVNSPPGGSLADDWHDLPPHLTSKLLNDC